MKLLSKKHLGLLAVVAVAPTLLGFSLIGPFNTAYQTAQLGYQGTNSMGLAELGGPMYLQAFYRYTWTNLNYAFDKSFYDYFGTNGVQAVRDAMAILNNLPAASKMDLNNYPLDTKLLNYQAQLAGLLDVKSYTLALMLEQMGLANPEKYTWTLRWRVATATQTNYVVISLNYDPYTLQPTNQVNGVQYTYRIQEQLGIADAVERPVTFNDRIPYSSVAGGILGPGYLYTGLTRDDVGGIKYLLNTNTLALEDLTQIPGFDTNGAAVDNGLVGWIGWQGTTNVLTNVVTTSNFWTPIILAAQTNQSNFFAVGIRGGVNKIHFTEVAYDSLLGTAFTPITNLFHDVVIASNHMYAQKYSRDVLVPDIVFVADHLGFNAEGTAPVLLTNSALVTVNNDLINGLSTEGGPGAITGPVQLTFNTDMGGLFNSTPYFLDEQWSTLGVRWASFDHTPRPPVIYPVSEGLTINQLLALIEQSTNRTSKALSPR
jgi:hypothetical protein